MATTNAAGTLAAAGLIGMGALTKVAAEAVDAGKAGMFLGGVNKAAGWLARAQSKLPGIGRASKLFGNDTMGAAREGLLNSRKGLLKIGWSKFFGRQVFRIGTASQKFHIDLLVGGYKPW